MPNVDIFISYAGEDQGWAEWIAWQLEAAGTTTRLQAWDFRPGGDFIHEMEQALQDAERLVAVLSPAYVASQFGEAEWRPVFRRDPSGDLGLLVPVRVQECDPPELLAARVYIDLVGLAESKATDRLLAGLRREERPGRPERDPPFPGAGSAGVGVPPPFPGRGPSISNLTLRNPHFTGRADLLNQLDRQLRVEGGVVAVVAAHGLGGVGKTQLALEYGYRHADQLDLIWWVPAENRLLATAALAELAVRLGLPNRAEQDEQASAAMAELSRRERWLLVFDNAEDPEALDGLWPTGGGGKVVVTSRNPAWGARGSRLAVGVLDQEEAAEFLHQRTGSRDRHTAEVLAVELGGLPLALEQAAAYLEQTGISLADYLARFRRYRAQLLGRGRPSGYPATVATTWRLNLEQLTGEHSAVGLLRLCAFLGPEPIPVTLLTRDRETLPAELAAATADELALDDTIAALYRFSLLGRDLDGLRLHRLVGEVVRATLELDQQQHWAAAAVALVAAEFPDDLLEPSSWPVCAVLLPHALAATEHAERLAVAIEETAELLDNVGGYLRHRAAFAAARVIYQRALRLAEAAYGPDHPKVNVHVNNLGIVLHDLGDLDGAKTHYERALRIAEAAYGPDHPEVAGNVNNLGFLLRELGDLEGAKTHHERALRIAEAAYDPNHPFVAAASNNLGMVLRALGDFDGAKTHYERALQIAEAAYGPDHPYVAAASNNLGFVLRALGDLDGAKTHYERALRIAEAAYDSDHPEVARYVNNLGMVLVVLGDLDGAKTHYERALQIAEAAYGPDHPEVARYVNNLGLVLRELGDLDGAKTHLERALRALEAVYGRDHPLTREVANNLARLAVQQ